MLVPRTEVLAQGVIPHLRGHHPETAEGRNLPRVPQAERSAAIALAPEGEYGIRARFHATMDLARKVDTQKWKSRIWNRIDKAAYKVLLGLRYLVVLAAEGYDLQV